MNQFTLNPKTAEERFWAKVNKAEGLGPAGDCWEWTAAKTTAQYGAFMKVKGVQILAHRFSYELTHGDIGDRKLFVCHRCDNPACVNPAHLFLGSHQQNVDDKMSKGRHYCTLKTECKLGHPLSGDNLYVSQGKRSCKQCKLERGKLRYKKQLASV
jgi:hypothetical protein